MIGPVPHTRRLLRGPRVRTVLLALRRARAQAGLLLLLLLVTAVMTTTVAGGVDHVMLASSQGLRDELLGSPPRTAALQLRARLADDAPAQREVAEDVLATTLGELPVSWSHDVTSLTLEAATDGAAGRVVLRSTPSPEVVEVREGTLPAPDPDWSPGSAPAPTAVEARAAEALGVGVGDVVEVTGSDGDRLVLEVSGLWSPRDVDDPRWFGDPLVADGVVPGADGVPVHGPLLVDEQVVSAVSGLDLVRWTLVPEVADLEPADLSPAAAALAAAATALEGDDAVAAQGLAVEGDLAGTFARLDTALSAARGATTAALVVLVLVGLVTLAQVARLLASLRHAHTALLRSRGASSRQLTALSAAEAATVTVPGALLGLVGVAVARAVTGASGPWTTVLALAAATAAVGAGVLTVVGADTVHGHRSATRRTSLRSTPLGTSAVALVLVAAVLAVAHLRRQGTPVVTTADGTAVVDVLAAAAAPVSILAVGLLVASSVGPAARAGAGLTARRTDLLPVLTLRRMSRDAAAPVAVTLLVALAAATAVVAGAWAGTWQAHRTTLAEVDLGTDVRVELTTPAGGTDAAAAYARLAGADATAPVTVEDVSAAGTVGVLVALPAAAVEQVVRGLEAAPALATALGGGPAEDDAPVPVVLSEAWAAAFELAVGDPTTLRVRDTPVPAVVVGTAPAIPGAGAEAAVLADLERLEEALGSGGARTAPEEVWISTGDPTGVAAAAAALPTTAAVRTTETGAPLSAPVTRAFWTAALATLLLALPGVGATTTALARARRPEVAALGALGLPAGAQARSRGAELAATAGAAGVLGAAGGLLVALAVVPTLVGATVGGSSRVDPVLHLDRAGTAALLAALTLVVGALTWAASRAVVRQAADPSWREDLS